MVGLQSCLEGVERGPVRRLSSVGVAQGNCISSPLDFLLFEKQVYLKPIRLSSFLVFTVETVNVHNKL